MLPPEYIQAITDVLKEMEEESPYGLRGWARHSGSAGQDEVPITRDVCAGLTRRGFQSTGLS